MGAMTKFRRKLDAGDLQRMNLPEEFWLSRVGQAPESVRLAIARYLRKIDQMALEGVGLFVTGPRGVGKTAIGALVLKEARARGYTAYFTSLWELREMIRSKVMFDEDTTMVGRCREVDFLVLDGMREEDAKESWLGKKEIEELIRYRGSKRLVTVITTPLSFDGLKEHFKGLLEAAQGYLVQFPVTGPNRHRERQQDLRRALFDE